MAAVPTPPDFPLLNLPFLGQKHVVWTMTIEEKFYYSLLSHNAKSLIKGLHHKADFLELLLTDHELRIHSNFSPFALLKIRLIPGDSAKPWPRLYPAYFNTAKVFDHVLDRFETIREWVDHIAEIFHTKNLKLHFQGGTNAFDFESVKARFQGYEIIGVSALNIGREKTQNVLRTFQSIREISWDRDPFEEADTERFEAVIRQKLDYFNFGHDIRDGLDTLMKMDCHTMEIPASHQETADFNRFIKNWINTDNYKNLKTLTVAVNLPNIEGNYQQEILNEISHRVVPKEEYRKFEMPYPSILWEKVKEIVGQFKIRNENGKKATIQLDRFGKCIRFKFIVGQ